MKVIVQDVATKLYLSANGAWVTEGVEARNFFSLMRAYHFASAKVHKRFRVLLYCPDDGYTSCIIEGEGIAETIEALTKPASESVTEFRRSFTTRSGPGDRRSIRFDETRNYLN